MKYSKNNALVKGGKRLLSVVISVSFALSLTPAAAFAAIDPDEPPGDEGLSITQEVTPELTQNLDYQNTAVIAAENLQNLSNTQESDEVTSTGWWSDEAYRDTSWYDASLNTYSLSSASQLAGFAYLVNSGNDFAGKTVRITSNIDLSAHYWVPVGGNRSLVGNTDVPAGTAFAGTFDGGYTNSSTGKISQYLITGLNIQWNNGNSIYNGNTVAADTSYASFGLFGYVTGTLMNINVSGSIVSNARMYEVAGVVGSTFGNVYNCTSSVSINLTGIYSARTGGVIGEAFNTASGVSNQIQYCSNTGTLNVVRYGGGIVGKVASTYAGGINITQCYNSATITDTSVSDAVQVGGIMGGGNGNISNCYSIGKITMSKTVSEVGGIVGSINGTSTSVRYSYANADFSNSASMTNLMPAIGSVNNNESPISNVLWVANNGTTQPVANGSNGWGMWTLSGPTSISLLVGGAGSGNPTVYTTTSSGSTSSNDYSVMYILGSGYYRNTGDYPRLNWQSSGLAYGDFGIGSGTQEDPFRITGQADLEAINEALAGNNGFSGKYFKIMNDITLDAGWKGLGTINVATALTNSPYPGENSVGFAGILDGNNSTITIARSVSNVSGQGGFINYLAPAGQISNLTVQGTFVITYTQKPNCTTDVDGISAFGGIVGYNCGVINNVSSRVTITNADGNADSSDDDITYIYNVGGIAGFNDAFYQEGARGTILNSRNYNPVTGYEKVGGITGENAGLIASCYNGGTITPTSTRRSGAGGIAGRNGNNSTAVETGIIRGCTNYGNITSGIAGTSQEAQATQSSWLGGIAGWLNSKSSIAYCYNKGNVQGYGYCGYIVGGTGYTTTSGETDYSSGVDKCYTGSDTSGATTGSQRGINGTTLQGGQIGQLNDGENAGYGTFDLVTSIPMSKFDATVIAEATNGWQYNQPTVYLDPSASTNGDGTSSTSPFNNVNDAVNAAGIGKVYVMSSITITSKQTMWDSTEFIRYTANNFSGPMFIINASDTDNELTYVTIGDAVVDGSDVGTLFQVNQGRLRLRGNMVLQNAAVGIAVDASSTSVSAQVELNEAFISTTTAITVGTTNAATIANDSVIYDAFGKYTNKLTGNIILGANTTTKAYVTVSSAITCQLNINYPSPAVGDTVLQASSSYTLTDDDVEEINLVDTVYGLELDGSTAGNKAIIASDDDGGEEG